MDTGLTENYLKKIASLEDSITAFLPTAEMKLTHHFAANVYARELFIPKGTVLTGKIHSQDCINIMLYGDITITTEDGPKRIDKPQVIVAKAGTKKAAFAHEDTVWINMHGTCETSLDKIEDLFTIDDPQEYIESLKRLEK